MSDCALGICDGSGFVIDDDANVARPCRCRAQRVARARTASLSAVIPRRYRGVGFDRPPVSDMPPHVVAVVRGYLAGLDANLEDGRGLCFMGPVGTGKTTLAMLVSKAALDAGRSVAIYSLPRLLAELRRSFDEGADHTHTQLLDRLAMVDLLHLDDLGAEKTSEWVLEQLYSIINARYEDQRSLVVTTNVIGSDLRAQLGDRIVSRLIEMCEDVPVHGGDMRETSRIKLPPPAQASGF